jgi:hypothetical protein
MRLFSVRLGDGIDYFQNVQNDINHLSVDQIPEFFLLNGLEEPNTGVGIINYSGLLKNEILAGRQIMVLGGKISYSDQLGNDHITTYCVTYIPKSDTFPEGWGACPIQQIAS